MNRVKRIFERMRKEGRCGLVAYVTCGDPDLETTIEIIRELEAAGADVIELGIPFSDPIADGPVIQAASQRALEQGTSASDVIQVARRVRQFSQIPLVAFSYLNPILRMGVERFASEAAEAGIDSLLLTDLPPESAAQFRRVMHANGMGMVFLLAPTSSEKRIAIVDRASDGFVYYVSTTGVTGARAELDPGLVERLRDVRRRVKKPLAVGFGVSKREHHEALAPFCDAVVVGSAIVRAIAAGDVDGAPQRAGSIVREILGG